MIGTTRDYVPSMSMRASAVKDEIEKMVRVYVGRTEEELAHWGVTLDGLTGGTDGADAGQIGGRLKADDLRSKYQAAQTRLAQFRNVGRARWGTCKLVVEQTWNDLEGALDVLRRDLTEYRIGQATRPSR